MPTPEVACTLALRELVSRDGTATVPVTDMSMLLCKAEMFKELSEVLTISDAEVRTRAKRCYNILGPLVFSDS